jgi:SIS domain-containing protein
LACSLGRGTSFPLALEGALKLKEISYIHAEGYAAGELKHGPIALIDESMPVIIIAPHDRVFEKTVSNMQEVVARQGKIILITDPQGAHDVHMDALSTLTLPAMPATVTPLVYAIPVQLIAYHAQSECHQGRVYRTVDVGAAVRNIAKAATKAAKLKNLAAFVDWTTILIINDEGGQWFSGLSTKAAKWQHGSGLLGRLRAPRSRDFRPHPPRRGGNFCHQAARREAQKPFAADDLFSSILGRARGRRLPWVRSKPVAHPRSKGRGAGWGHHAVLELLSTSMCPSSHTRRPPPSYILAR